jgi:hypothetical protein
MNTLKDFLCNDTRYASAACFAGFYVISLGAVISMIECTQLLLGLI